MACWVAGLIGLRMIHMLTNDFNNIFNQGTLEQLLPKSLSDNFFDALYGDASEGAYDISLSYAGKNGNALYFEFHLNERPGKCLACNLTYGLPQVFSRHPLINVKGLVDEIDKLLEGKFSCSGWELGRTREISRQLHVIPLVISGD